MLITVGRTVMRQRLGWMMLIAVAGCGSDSTGPTTAVSPPVAAALALGTQFTCALTRDATSYCWGADGTGQLGDSSFVGKLVPTPTAGMHSYAAISAAVGTACALDRDGRAWCWGDDPNQPGVRLGYQIAAIAEPTAVRFTAISVGRKFACGLDAGGSAFCWGENGRGQLGVGDTLRHAAPAAVTGGLHFTTLAAGFWSVCGLTAAGKAYCWGDNSYGELGSGDTLSVSSPRAVSGTATFRSLAGGSIHACAIATTGGTMCWGANFSGQLGDGTSTGRLVPTAAAAGLTFTSIRAGRANSIFTTTCGLTAAGDVYCWGWNSKGQLGAGPSTDPCVPFQAPGTTGGGPATSICSYRPLKVNGLVGVVALDVGFEHACALTSVGQIFCWGDNQNGELGDGTGVAQPTPVLVKGGLAFR
jgi:alpha-tubulin suppressor-like RCC1 family protein